MEYYDYYEIAMHSITDDCLADNENLGPYIRIKKESKAKNLMTTALTNANASQSVIDEVLMEIMHGLCSPRYGR